MSATATSNARYTAVPKSLGHCLVTGGCGGLGNKIITLLLSRSACSKISSVDVRPPAEPLDGCDYHFGDLTDEAAMRELLAKLKPTTIIHTASPQHDVVKEILYKVNVKGTETLVKVAQESGVKAFVYTSSASVVSDNTTDLINADEDYPYVVGSSQPEYYTETKALAEQHVLSQNRPASRPNFLTCAIRPSGIYGEGDLTVLPGILKAYYEGKTKFQLGDNKNLFDFTENTNVAHAHHLAAAALLTTLDREEQGMARPLDSERVDGEAFFITNDAPIYFWDFTRTVWRYAGDTTTANQIWTLPKDLSIFIASMLEWIGWITMKGPPTLTRTKVTFACMTRYYNINKAKRRLGYMPVVGMEEGLKRAVEDCIRRGAGVPPHMRGSVESKKDL